MEVTQTFTPNALVSASDAIVATATDANGNTSEFSGTTPLPVELVSFNYSMHQNIVELTWYTATEVNDYGFDIERRLLPAGNWESIGFVNGSGNSNSPKTYSFTDRNLKLGSYSYRLKQIDNDGKFSYSKELNVSVNNLPKVYALMQNFPNPFNPTTVIRYILPEHANVNLVIYEILGREVAELVKGEAEAGYYEVKFNAGSYASGIYLEKLSDGSFTQVHKMMLMK